jgi:HK97 family phage major capsid protein
MFKARITAAREAREALLLEADKLTKKEERSEEDAARFKTIIADVKKRADEIKDLEQLQRDYLDTRTNPQGPAPAMDPDEKPEKRSAVPAQPKKRENPWSSFGEYLQAVHRAADSGMQKIDPRLRGQWVHPDVEERATGANEAIGSQGGFLVETDYYAAVMEKMHDSGQIWGRCDRVPISRNANSVKLNAINETSRADGSRWGGVQAYWLAEAGTKQASKPELRQIELSLKKLAALFYATDEVLEDAPALSAIASSAFTKEIMFKVEDAIINGTGAGMPLGILLSPALVTQAKEVGQPAATINSNNIVKMWSRLWAPSQTSPSLCWLVNQDVFPQLYTMGITVGTGGSPIFQPPGGLSASPYSTLLGKPIIPVEFCATLGTVGDIILADLAEYMTADKGGIQGASSIHVNFVYDETVFRWVFRVDGQPKWNSTLTPKNSTQTQSPFVVLATRV